MDRSYDFDPTPPNLLLRVATTPVSDALRGRFAGRYDAHNELAASGLPAPIAGMIQAVVRKTRLWRHERIDVARELINHFQDGFDAGRNAEQLAGDFGSVEQAARLIRQAKRRQRPLYWQAWWYVSRAFLTALAILAVGYGGLAARFLLTRSNLSHNYSAEINQARTVPDDQRAWPLYRDAALKLSRDDRKMLSEDSPGEAPLDDSQAGALLDRNQEILRMVHEAAARPALGYLLGDPADRDAAQAPGGEGLLQPHPPLASDNPSLIAVTLDGMQVLRLLTRLVNCDARHAAVQGDGARIVQDVQTLLSISEQAFQPRATLVEQLVGMTIFGVATETVGRILHTSPDTLSDDQLRELAHLFAGYRDGDLRIDFEAERMLFLDQLQRVYSDDGHGDGRISPEGLRALLNLFDTAEPATRATIFGPGIAALVAGRAEEEQYYSNLLNQGLAARQSPPWQWDAAAFQQLEERMKPGSNPVTRMRHALTYLLLPAVLGVVNAAERATLNRDTATTAIALTLWHRRHKAWPERLKQLVPDLLPVVPPDRFDGQPLRYTVRDGQPLLYCLGSDRDDDQGEPSVPPETAMGPFGPPPASLKVDSGDWILWPPAKPAPVPPEESS